MRILIVEDEESLRRQLAAAAGGAGYAVDQAADGERADFLGQTERYDAVVLDLGLPSVDGLTILRRWREAGLFMPVLVLTARGSWHEKVLGIDGGADDYLAKPFRMEEVLARLRGLIRRASGQLHPELRCGALSLDPRSARVAMDGLPVRLTSHEYRVLSYLMHHRGRVVSQGELTDHIYAQGCDRDSNTVEVFIARLRRKLGPSLIETIRGLGYRIGAQR
ncbi:MAG TPA: response regulator transcription factor [Thermoanaerobaculia bacterium]|jgi:two-component system OmpR family response regulator|nr:response regulator transcription factor [Thermoanaerobaculia bacterium]